MNKHIPQIILASKSPRRQELLRLMDLDFRIVLKDVDESYPDGLSPEEIAVYIAKKKAEAFDEMVTDEVVLTADTIVSIGDKILGKRAFVCFISRNTTLFMMYLMLPSAT
jgi:septum formation protein